MPQDCNAFDFDTITDVVINLRYTARYGGDNLRNFARKVAVLPTRPVQVLPASSTPFPNQKDLQRLFSLKHEFPTEWYKFLHPSDPTTTSQSMQIALGNERFPYQYRGKTITQTQAELVLLFSDPQFLTDYRNGTSLSLELGPPNATIPPSITNPSSVTLTSSTGVLGGAPYGSIAQPKPAGPNAPNSWVLQALETAIAQIDPHLYLKNTVAASDGTTTTYHHLNPDVIDDILLLCHYSVSPAS